MLDVIVFLAAAALRMSTSISLVAIGGALSEKAGVINLGLEGIMLIGAFFATYGSWKTGNPWLGILLAACAGATIGLLLGLWSIKFRANQVVVGVSINMLAAGVTTVLLQVIWGNKARSPFVPTIAAFESSWLANNAGKIGLILDGQSPVTWFMLVVAVVIWVLIYCTVFGLRLRVSGEQPKAAIMAGISVTQLRYLAVIAGGAVAGVGGAYLSVAQLGHFGRGMTAGRGFVAIAAVVFGNWNPLAIVGTSLLFGLFEALQMYFQGRGIPSQFMQMIPYIATIVAVSMAKRSRPPKALGVPFQGSS